MLVCPQCQYDNPNNSESCEHCGVSLTHKPCYECGASVAYSAQKCPQCDTFTGTVWWAIIAQPSGSQLEDTEPLGVLLSVKSSSGGSPIGEQRNESDGEKSLAQSSFKISPNEYLDPGKRYRFLASEQTGKNLATSGQDEVFQGIVLDCQPLQKSVLKVLVQEQGELFTEPNHPHELKAVLWSQMGVPQIALPYLTLSDLYPLIPEVHDAWSDGTREVILLADRSHWHLLSELGKQGTLPSLQIIYWLNEMAKLWTSLSEIRCCQSLLLESNLRVDEDQSFGLQRLYPDPANAQPRLQDLAQIWQNLLKSSGHSQLQPLSSILEQMKTGQIDNIVQLRLKLQNLAAKEQTGSANQPFSQPGGNLESGITPEDSSIDTSPQEETMLEGGEDEDLSTAVLPMQMLSLTDAGLSDIGRQRRHNEDHFGMTTEIKKQQGNRGQIVQGRGLYIVCDGMGGHACGEIASAMAVETLQRYFMNNWQQEFPDAKMIEQAIFLANQTIYRVNQEKDSYGSARMGTTLVMALVQDTRVAIAHVGDSRIYRVNRKWGLEQLTQDHEVGQRAIQEGMDPKIAYSRPDAYQLTQALGPHDNQYVKPDIKFLTLHEDTLLLLCSDGLSDNKLVETHWQTYLAPLISSSTNLEEGIHKLVALANQKNGHDNITAILVRIKVQPNLDKSLWL